MFHRNQTRAGCRETFLVFVGTEIVVGNAIEAVAKFKAGDFKKCLRSNTFSLLAPLTPQFILESCVVALLGTVRTRCSQRTYHSNEWIPAFTLADVTANRRQFSIRSRFVRTSRTLARLPWRCGRIMYAVALSTASTSSRARTSVEVFRMHVKLQFAFLKHP